MLGKKKHQQTVEDYIYAMTDQGRLELMKFLSKYGEPNAVLKELLAIEPCVQTKKREVRINENYMLWYQKKTLLTNPQLYLFRIDTMKMCYYSICRNGDYGRIGWLKASGEDMYFSRLEQGETAAVFRELTKYVRDFDALPTADVQDDRLLISFDKLHYYFFRGNTLYYRKIGELSKKPKDTVWIQNIQDIIWCDQWYAWDSDASDSYALDVYLVNEKKPTFLFSDSEENVFEIVKELKKRVPHLLYGSSREYEAMFKRDRAQLMALAKGKRME